CLESPDEVCFKPTLIPVRVVKLLCSVAELANSSAEEALCGWFRDEPCVCTDDADQRKPPAGRPAEELGHGAEQAREAGVLRHRPEPPVNPEKFADPAAQVEPRRTLGIPCWVGKRKGNHLRPCPDECIWRLCELHPGREPPGQEGLDPVV